ncbi:MAG TPA: hypothetical protein VND88_03875 [Candidatus Acidoferrales bacterium]|nr:hypothetical protein [Candidatus Acidoferrales bacterium]
MIGSRKGTSHRSPGEVAFRSPDRATSSPETVAGNQACSALRCSSLAGMPCSYVDRRGRRCKTAWCPVDRHVVEGRIYCALHAHAMQALEWEFGAASHPDVDSRTVPILQWISSAAADEVIATLNVYCALHGEMLVAEPVRRKFNPVAHSRVWEKQWKTLSPTNVSLRVCIASDEARPTEIHIQVNGHDVNVVPPPWNRDLTEPTEADLRWLDQEVLAPIGAAVARWMMKAAADEGLGYMPIGGGIDVADAQLIARPADSGAAGAATPLRSEVDEAALDEVRRAHFLYGLEEIQAVTERRIEAG